MQFKPLVLGPAGDVQFTSALLDGRIQGARSPVRPQVVVKAAASSDTRGPSAMAMTSKQEYRSCPVPSTRQD
eukprot:6204513-Pleurochrysis_carterae.AAC.4